MFSKKDFIFIFQFIHLIIMTFSWSSTGWCQMILDGTLGHHGALTGPNYQITADLGQQHGSHLFHSFEQFNLHPNEEATFSGPNSVNNIISRVTGGHPSQIHGTLRSKIPGADLYLLNPAGIVFGQGAELNVQGAFHASTADTLRFEDGNEFNARQPQSSLLTVAPLRAFGFLTDNPSPIRVEDSTLSVAEGRTLSLIGGDLNLNNAELEAGFGRLNLASLASHGEVVPTESDLNLSTQAQRGSITANNAFLDVSGEEGGSVFIRGGRFELNGSQIKSETSGHQDGGVIDIQVDQLRLQTSIVDGNTKSSGKSSTIILKADNTLELSGASGIYSISISTKPNAGDAGNIEINADQLTLKDASQIASETYGPGTSGTIIIKVNDTLNGSGLLKKEEIFFKDGALFSEGDFPCGIFSHSDSKMANAGSAGNIKIEARQINLSKGAQISSSTFGPGEAGTILIVTDVFNLQFSGIFATSGPGISGQAGKIEIEAHQLTMTEGGQINTSARGTGKGGSIFIKVGDSMNLSGSMTGIVSSSEVTEGTGQAGQAGDIHIETHQLQLSDQSAISGKTFGSGKGGVLKIKASQLTLSNGSQINASSKGSGEGGTIVITLADALTLSGNGVTLTGVFTGSKSREVNAGQAGNIKIQAKKITIEDTGQISSSTKGPGGGGSIVIKVDESLTLSGYRPWAENQFFKSGILARSEKEGKAGSIEIETDQVILKDGAIISSRTLGTGKGGIIEIKAHRLRVEDGATISGSTLGSGEGNLIIISLADALTISGHNEEGYQSGIWASSHSPEANAGNAGDIKVQASSMKLTDGGIINAQSEKASGGNITVTAPHLLYLQKGWILTNVIGGQGNSGNITIDQAHLTVLNHGEINANAYGGDGGNISLKTHQYIKSAESVVDASSRLGIDGNILIDAPDSNLGDQLVALPKTPSNPSLPNRCATQLRNGKESSRFIRVNRVGKRRDELNGGVFGSYLDIATTP